jgi:hypothetical protein
MVEDGAMEGVDHLHRRARHPGPPRHRLPPSAPPRPGSGQHRLHPRRAGGQRDP